MLQQKALAAGALLLLLIIPAQMVLALTPSINVSNDSDLSSNPRVAASLNFVYVVWQDNTTHQIMIKVSSDLGKTFSPATVLSGSGSAEEPHLATRLNSVYVTWTETVSHHHKQVMFRVSHDSGAAWNTAINLSNDAGKAYRSRVVGVSGTDVFVTWIDNSNGNNE